jgi:hypothetical protein
MIRKHFSDVSDLSQISMSDLQALIDMDIEEFEKTH